MVKLDHFLSFVDQPYFYQDVAYGTRTLKLDSWDHLVIPNVIRIVGRSTMIEHLQVREASQRRSLQGLDNTAIGGAEGFEAMHEIVKELEEGEATEKWCEEVRRTLKDAKRYMKTEYGMHCQEDGSPCPDHCMCFSLSDPQNPEFQGSCSHEHHASCDSCESLKSVIQAIGKEIESPSITFDNIEKKEDLKHDHDEAREAIFQWKAHIIRTKNQARAKQNLLTSLQKNASLIVMDWAMKFIQLKYREKQSEWFGKRGINWHVSSVITRNGEDNGLEIMSYVYLFESCAQDWYTVCAILENLLGNIKQIKPTVNEVFLLSDGAG